MSNVSGSLRVRYVVGSGGTQISNPNYEKEKGDSADSEVAFCRA